jgi:hypothetical protein
MNPAGLRFARCLGLVWRQRRDCDGLAGVDDNAFGRLLNRRDPDDRLLDRLAGRFGQGFWQEPIYGKQ